MSMVSHRSGGTRALVEGLEARRLYAADPVLAWNDVALDAVAADHTPSEVASPDQGGPTRTSRALAIVQAAVFDAVNSIDGSYRPYLVAYRGYRDASVDAAVAEAAHDTLAALYPHQRDAIDAALASSLAAVPDGRAEDRGVDLGARVARAILAARQHDGAGRTAAYDEPVEPGVFQPFPGEPDPLGVAWGGVTPFVMRSGSQFRAAPPPALTSPEYAAAYDEVKAYGGDGVTTPTARTAEQTEIGTFWAYDGTPGMGTPPRLYNQIAQVVARQEGNTQVENARLFALVNLAMADAGIASWDTKYTYDVWRPIRGIRQEDALGYALDDGNPLTEADPDWTPLGAPYTNGGADDSDFTPPFPAYTSGHATFGAALFETLRRFYGRDDVTFTVTSDEYNGVNADADGIVRPLKPRTFTSFSQAAEENGQSRIYLGVHWAFDKTAGIKQGDAIADYTFEHALNPVGSDSGQHRPHHDRRHDEVHGWPVPGRSCGAAGDTRSFANGRVIDDDADDGSTSVLE